MEGVVQPYAWGSKTFIPELLGTEPTDEPQAELWLGAHPSAAATLDGQPIDTYIQADPKGFLGAASVEEFGPRLSFLLKVLAADEPLSLQAHPSRKQAEEGYAREEEAGVAADAKDRLYKDDWPKPELLCALVESEALCGFRDPDRTYALVQQLGGEKTLALMAPLGDTSRSREVRLEQVFTTIMRLDDPQPYVAEVAQQAEALDADAADGELGQLADTVRLLADALRRRPRRPRRAADEPGGPAARRRDLPRRGQPARLPARRRHRDHGQLRQRPARRAHQQARRRRRADEGPRLPPDPRRHPLPRARRPTASSATPPRRPSSRSGG